MYSEFKPLNGNALHKNGALSVQARVYSYRYSMHCTDFHSPRQRTSHPMCTQCRRP